MTEKPLHKPNTKHTLEEILKSLQDLIRNDLLEDQAPPRAADASTPAVPAPDAPASDDDFEALRHSLESLVTGELTAEELPTESGAPAADASLPETTAAAATAPIPPEGLQQDFPLQAPELAPTPAALATEAGMQAAIDDAHATVEEIAPAEPAREEPEAITIELPPEPMAATAPQESTAPPATQWPPTPTFAHPTAESNTGPASVDPHALGINDTARQASPLRATEDRDTVTGTTLWSDDSRDGGASVAPETPAAAAERDMEPPPRVPTSAEHAPTTTVFEHSEIEDTTTTPVSVGDWDDIPVLSEVVPESAPAEAEPPPTPAPAPPTRRPGRPEDNLSLPLPAPSRAHDLAVRAVAKLNIELRKSGKRPLDPKVIARLAMMLRETLESDAAKVENKDHS